MDVFLRKDLWPCYISIFFGLFSLMGISATITMHLVQDYGYDAHIAYYFFAVWSFGQTIGNCFASCMIPYIRPIIRVSFVVQVGALMLTGPTNVIPQMGDLDRETQLIIMGIGLLAMGLTSAAQQTLGNIESVVRA